MVETNCSAGLLGFKMIRKSGILFLLFYLITACSSDDGPELPQISLLSQTEIQGNLTTDVWGYVDQASGKEYAIVGDFSNLRDGNVTLIDVTEPIRPQVSSTISNVVGFDMKTFDHYLYVTNSDFPSASDDSSRIIDISHPEAPVVIGAFQPAHNIFIEGAYLYMSFEFPPGLRIFDIASDPLNPELVWENPTLSGGHDVAVIRNRLYDFHAGDATYIYDVQDPANPQLLGAVRSPNTYHHSGWVTEDNNYLYICDETAADPLPDITIWDISEPDNPFQVGEISDSTSRAHNLYIINNLAYVSYYGAGFKIFDVSIPSSPVLLDQFETNLNGGSGIGNGFLGAFGVYPFSSSGNIFVSDMDNGLFVLEYR
jgi:choice-of-anchor B domain-containing protein